MTEFRPGRFEILPTIIKNLLIINTLVFIAQITVFKNSSIDFDGLFALHTWQSPKFQPWQFFTYMFLHGGWDHLFGNMFVLWMFGSTLENLWGPKRFLMFYIVSGLGAALCNMTVQYFEMQPIVDSYNSASLTEQMTYHDNYMALLNMSTVGASGAIYGCLAAFGYLFPNDYIYIYFLFPLKVKWFVLGYIGLELYLQVKSSPGDIVAHVAHLGGALVGFLLVYFWNKNNRRRSY
jgi:membrane associated rhomboid family serine protease